MRHILAALLLLPSLAFAQTCPLGQPLTSPNQGNIGGGLYFNLTVNTTVTLTHLNYVASDSSLAGTSSLNVFVGPPTWVGQVSTNPGPWLLVGATTPVAITGGVDTPVAGVLVPAGINPGPVTFAPGNYGIALQAVGHSWGYQNGSFTFASPGGEFSVSTGGASNAFLTLPTFSPRTINGSIDYTPGGTPMSFANVTPYGKGCYGRYRSIYEFFPSSLSVDFNHTSMSWTLDAAGNRWSSITAGSTPVQPVASPSLGHTDDSVHAIHLASSQTIQFPSIGGLGTATDVDMCSNGYLDLMGNAPPVANPTVAATINGPSVRMGNHCNLDPAAGGTTHYDYDAASSAHLFTWLNVPTAGSPATSNTFQMAFFANGNVEFRWGAMSQIVGIPTFVGFTPGGISLDPGSIDLSASLPAFTSGVDQGPLSLVASGPPLLGTTIQLTTGNVTGTSIGACFISVNDLPPFSPVGLDLGLIGAPGCVANVVIDIPNGLTAAHTISNLGGTQPGLTVPLAIPASPQVLGLHVYAQSIWADQAANPLGFLTSNALRISP
jgi:hypothetical protein